MVPVYGGKCLSCKAGARTLGVKRPGRGADYSPPFSAKVKNDGDVPPLLLKSSWRGA
jgi:hypothetical protein